MFAIHRKTDPVAPHRERRDFYADVDVDVDVDVEGAGSAFIVGGTLDFGSTANPFAYGNSISAEGGALVRLGGLAIFDSDNDLPVDGSSSMEIGSAGAASTANVPASTPVWLAVTVNVIGPVQARIEHLALLAGF